MVASVVWKTNVLEDTLPKGLKEDEAIAFLTKYYNEDRSYSIPSGLSQLAQHLQAFELMMLHKSHDLTADIVKEAHGIMMKGLANEGVPVRNGAYREISVAARSHVFPSYKCIRSP